MQADTATSISEVSQQSLPVPGNQAYQDITQFPTPLSAAVSNCEKSGLSFFMKNHLKVAKTPALQLYKRLFDFYFINDNLI